MLDRNTWKQLIKWKQMNSKSLFEDNVTYKLLTYDS